MIMMDISMYGHHNQHGATYNSTAETNYYNFNSDLTHTNHQFSSNHYPSYHYDDTSYLYGTTTDSVETPPSPQDLNYYPHQAIQENPIINTDTGLSYTNLDYNNTNGNHMYHPQATYNESYQRQDALLRHEDNADGQQLHQNYVHDNKYHIENDVSYHHQPSSSCMEFQQLHRYKEEVMHGDGRLRGHHVMHSINAVPQPQPVLPTYKWMQVKRNVPKPGEYLNLVLKKVQNLHFC